ncbi:MAG: hypothetical protein QOH58_178 [Thermoleophilaceae bacterium]|nr:hypothetical protein [Thermoleophilaceae bacterium]
MTDFFGALELELHEAAERRLRRPVRLGQGLGALAVLALLATAVGVALAIGRGGGEGATGQLTGAPKPDPVGTVIAKGEGDPPRRARSLVVASGRAPISGPWQIEVSRTKGARDTDGRVLWHKGYCGTLHIIDPPGSRHGGFSGFCGSPRNLGFRKTPGFSRHQGLTASKPPPKEVLVWGRVPDRAEKVVITAGGRTRYEVVPTDGPKTFPGRYYVVPVKPGLRKPRINWLDAEGKPGSRGIRLLPPASRR